MKKYVCIAVVCILGLQSAGAQEKFRLDLSTFDVPSFSPVLGSYFAETLARSLFARFDYLDLNFESLTIKSQSEDDVSENLFNSAMVFNVRLTKTDALVRFAIPLYYGMIMPMSGAKEETASSSFGGSGLHIMSDYISLYGFVGYGWGRRFDANNSAYTESGVLWSVMPEVNMKKLPVLGGVFSLLKGYLSMDSSSDEFKPLYQTQLLFRDINIGQSVISLAAVTGSNWYNSEAKSTVYGGRFGIETGLGTLRPLFIIEGGYQSFFDVIAANPSYYEDGPYGRLFLGVSLPVPSTRSYGTLCLTAESSPQNWPLPKFGIFLGYHGNIRAKSYINMFDDDRAKGARITGIFEDVLYETIVRKFF